jgi:glycosyltransferase involved in cell wall biosynthesis
LKLAFQNLGGSTWQAGQNFLEGTLAALRSLKGETPALFLVVAERAPESYYEQLLPYVDKIVPVPFGHPRSSSAAVKPNTSLRAHAWSTLRRRLGGRRPAVPPPIDPLSTALGEHGADVYFSIASGPARDLDIPQISWIYDFQHHRLPDLFSAAERRARDEAFLDHGRRASRVLVTSPEVFADLAAFDSETARKARVVQFVPHIPPAVYLARPDTVLQRFHLPERFFHLPNQWWQHKNHKLVLEALALLQRQGVRPVVVCTGALVDERNPSYIEAQIQMLSAMNIREQVILLGTVPRADVFSLMRQSICIINPTRFEGMGLSAAEARSIGKNVLLSDLPVLRNQSIPNASYFNPEDPQQLADKMYAIWQSAPIGPDLELEASARAAQIIRQQSYGLEFLNLAHEAVSSTHRASLNRLGSA